MPLPLENWLEYQANRKPDRFPNNSQNYFYLYHTQKQRFAQAIYPFVNSGMIAAEDNRFGQNFYTDHGINHVDAVIKTVGELLGCVRRTSRLALSPYEVYLLLMVIISHDAGNIEGRDEHELKVNKILQLPATNVLNETVEIRIIHDIAKSHTGKGFISGAESKNTIATLQSESSYRSVIYRPRVIAALMRFADEICEDRRRVPGALISNTEIFQGPSAPFLHFGLCITSVEILPKRKSIQIQVELTTDQIEQTISYTDLDGNTIDMYLIDIILDRLEKIRRERAYCFRYLHGAVDFESVSAEISVQGKGTDDMYYLRRVGIVDLSDEDYPQPSSEFKEKYQHIREEVVKRANMDSE